MRWLILALVASLAFAVTGCGGGEGGSPDTNSPATVAVTGTPRPVSTPATPTPRTGPPTAEAVIEAMQARKLQIGENASYSRTSDPEHLVGLPHQYTSRVNFADIRIRPMTTEDIFVRDGGSIEAFANEEDARARYDAVSAADPGPRTYIEGVLVLRITDSLTDEQAAEYEKAFREIVRGE